jgi:hypothetical protein
MNEKKTPTSVRKPKKSKEQDQLEKTNLRTLRQGQRLDTSKTKLCSSKERKPPPKLENYKELPLNQCNSPSTNACKPLHETVQLQRLSSDRSDRSPSPVRLVDKIAQHLGTKAVRPVHITGQADATWETARAQK